MPRPRASTAGSRGGSMRREPTWGTIRGRSTTAFGARLPRGGISRVPPSAVRRPRSWSRKDTSCPTPSARAVARSCAAASTATACARTARRASCPTRARRSRWTSRPRWTAPAWPRWPRTCSAATPSCGASRCPTRWSSRETTCSTAASTCAACGCQRRLTRSIPPCSCSAGRSRRWSSPCPWCGWRETRSRTRRWPTWRSGRSSRRSTRSPSGCRTWSA